MAEQAGIGAFFLTEALVHRCVRDIVDLVGSGSKQQAVHDRGHMAGDTSAGFSAGCVPSVRLRLSGIPAVALRTHLVWGLPKAERLWIRLCRAPMHIMTMTAMGLTFLKASRALQSLYDEGGFAKAAILVKRLARELAKRAALVGRIEWSSRQVVQFAP